MTVITSGRRCNPFSIPAIAIAFFIVFALYIWSVKLEERLQIISSVLRQGAGASGLTSGWQVTDDDVAPDWGWADTEATDIAIQDEALPELSAHAAGADVDAARPNGAAAVPIESQAATQGTSQPSENSATDAQIADTWKSPSTPAELAASQPFDCSLFPGAQDVLLVMKTGATELLRRVPVHLLSTFTCVPDYLVFSSLSQSVGHIPIYDALANISDTYKGSVETLQTLYPRLKEYHHKGWDVSTLAHEGSWELDKWKNVPMALESYRMHPYKKWYVFLDADSAVIWSNLLHLLSKLNPEDPLYLGSPVYIGDTTFAHGGSGYIVSNAAMEKLAAIEADKKAAWEERTTQVCCGDMMFAEALRDAGVGLTGAVPAAYGGTPRTVGWTPEVWCKAPVFFHHMQVPETEELWGWEQNWLREHGREKPIILGDLFYHFVGQYLLSAADDAAGQPSMPPEDMRTSWSNMASHQSFTRPEAGSPEALPAEQDVLQPYASIDACRERCQAEEWCVQWQWLPDQCSLGEVPALGRTPRTEWDQGMGEAVDKMVSGWVRERIASYFGRIGECPEGSEF